MKHSMQVNSEIILNVTRILILLSHFDKQKSTKITIDKIMLFDFYMKYPKVMVENNELSDQYSFYDYYAYYHWKPDREEYHRYLRYLTAKRLISRSIQNNEFIYQITQDGNDVTDSLRSTYSESLKLVAMYIKKNIAKLSDTRIEGEIINKSLARIKNQSQKVD